MAEASAHALRLLSAELNAELERIKRTIQEIDAALTQLDKPDAPRVTLYGAAALLETFYSGVEKALSRIAKCFGTQPTGSAWHRELLESSTLDLAKIRPPILSTKSAQALDPYLSFRHRFRNLYLFDLDLELTKPLLQRAPEVWTEVATDLGRFSNQVEQIADILDRDDAAAG